MAEYTATVTWSRGSAAFVDNRYSRAHRWLFDGGAEVAASSSPEVVPVPMSDPEAVDPEEAFVASVASCHMLWFLTTAARAGYVVETYTDDARATLGRDDRGRQSITRVALCPRVTYDGKAPDAAAEAELHHIAHEQCFIAASVRSKVTIDPRQETQPL